ncbi:MAG: Pycsar system effector family protein, partial [Pseudonocardiaceae bacterium]
MTHPQAAVNSTPPAWPHPTATSPTNPATHLGGPRRSLIRGSRRQVLAYFGDVARVRHEGDLEYLLMQLAERPSEAVLSELSAISKIVVIKYRFARCGILCAIAGGTLLIMSAI